MGEAAMVSIGAFALQEMPANRPGKKGFCGNMKTNLLETHHRFLTNKLGDISAVTNDQQQTSYD